MFFGLDNTLRSLTASPMTTAIDQARRMAQHRLEAGGIVSGHGRDDDDPGPFGFVLPSDIDPVVLATAIEDGLRPSGRHQFDRPGAALLTIDITADGRIVVPRHCLGHGAVDRGKRFLDRIISEIRARRTLMMSREVSSGR
jgi:hypothetical protein